MVTTAVTVACHIRVPGSGRVVDVDILELSESACSGVRTGAAADGEGICLVLAFTHISQTY